MPIWPLSINEERLSLHQKETTMDQNKVAQAATAAVVFVSESLAEEGISSACQWYSIAESFVGASTWEDRKTFHAAFDVAMKRYSALKGTR